MTTESDQHVARSTSGATSGAHRGDGSAPARTGGGRSAKLLPPADPIGTLARPALEERLAEGTERRLTIVVGGAGFGKSTLAAQIAASRPTAWYTLDASDRYVGALAAGVVAALRVRLPDLPADLAVPVETSIEAAAHLGLVSALVAAGRHGEGRRRYGFYAAKMDEIAVEAAPFPAATGSVAASR